MSLIKCPKCGTQQSNFQEVCINCGFPIEKYVLYSDEISIEEFERLEKSEEADQVEISSEINEIDKSDELINSDTMDCQQSLVNNEGILENDSNDYIVEESIKEDIDDQLIKIKEVFQNASNELNKPIFQSHQETTVSKLTKIRCCRCGKENDYDARFCVKCGDNLESQNNISKELSKENEQSIKTSQIPNQAREIQNEETYFLVDKSGNRITLDILIEIWNGLCLLVYLWNGDVLSGILMLGLFIFMFPCKKVWAIEDKIFLGKYNWLRRFIAIFWFCVTTLLMSQR